MKKRSCLNCGKDCGIWLYCSKSCKTSYRPNMKMSTGTHSNLRSCSKVNISIDTHTNVRNRRASHFRMLDLFCGEGLAGWGYWLSGRFSEIVGVDMNPKMADRYAFDFIQGDALKLDYEFLSQFDFIHASPPCQAYSKATPNTARKNHVRLIAASHLMLVASGKPYVIENVEGSSKDLRPNIVLNGHTLGLKIDRRRYFHASILEQPIRKIMRSSHVSHKVHNSMNRTSVIEAMGLRVINPNALRKMTVDGMLQGVPPAMTTFISSGLFAHKVMIGA